MATEIRKQFSCVSPSVCGLKANIVLEKKLPPSAETAKELSKVCRKVDLLARKSAAMLREPFAAAPRRRGWFK